MRKVVTLQRESSEVNFENGMGCNRYSTHRGCTVTKICPMKPYKQAFNKKCKKKIKKNEKSC